MKVHNYTEKSTKLKVSTERMPSYLSLDLKKMNTTGPLTPIVKQIHHHGFVPSSFEVDSVMQDLTKVDPTFVKRGLKEVFQRTLGREKKRYLKRGCWNLIEQRYCVMFSPKHSSIPRLDKKTDRIKQFRKTCRLGTFGSFGGGSHMEGNCNSLLGKTATLSGRGNKYNARSISQPPHLNNISIFNVQLTDSDQYKMYPDNIRNKMNQTTHFTPKATTQIYSGNTQNIMDEKRLLPLTPAPPRLPKSILAYSGKRRSSKL